VVAEFLRSFPQVDVRLLPLDRTVDLVEEGQDVAVRIGELPDSSLIATRVGAIRRIVCASPAYLATRGVPRAPADLAQHDCITFTAVAQPDRWAFPGARGERRVAIHSRLVVNGAEAAVDMATAGLGITRVLSYRPPPPSPRARCECCSRTSSRRRCRSAWSTAKPAFPPPGCAAS
jgi:DNA-binding transcriptional LysR family regulator